MTKDAPKKTKVEKRKHGFIKTALIAAVGVIGYNTADATIDYFEEKERKEEAWAAEQIRSASCTSIFLAREDRSPMLPELVCPICRCRCQGRIWSHNL